MPHFEMEKGMLLLYTTGKWGNSNYACVFMSKHLKIRDYFFYVLLGFIWVFWMATVLQYEHCLKALSDLPKFFIMVKQGRKNKT